MRRGGHGAACAGSAHSPSGNRTKNVDPRPISVSKVRVPPCLSTTTSRAIESPWPVPAPHGLRREEGVEDRGLRRRPGSRHPCRSIAITTASSSRRRASRGCAPYDRCPPPTSRDGVRGVDDEVQDHLVELARDGRRTSGRSPSSVSTSATYLTSLRATVSVLEHRPGSGRPPSFPSGPGWANSFMRAHDRGHPADAVERLRRWRSGSPSCRYVDVGGGLAPAATASTQRRVDAPSAAAAGGPGSASSSSEQLVRRRPA